MDLSVQSTIKTPATGQITTSSGRKISKSLSSYQSVGSSTKPSRAYKAPLLKLV